MVKAAKTAKAAKAKAATIVATKQPATIVATKQPAVSAMACGFRNLMKYRASDRCKQATSAMPAYALINSIHIHII